MKQAIFEMSDYLVKIRIKNNVWGQLITVTKKSTNVTYIYSDVDVWWHSNPTPETIIDVDFENFVNEGSQQNNKRELAAFLANISKETTGGWQLPVGDGSNGDYAQWGLYFVHEVGYTTSNGAGAYSQAHAEYPPNPAVGYYGRGPIQLSWNYNYGQFSKFLFNDKNILLNNPDLIQQDGVLALKSAIWFWMMPQCPKPSCHQVMQEVWEAEAGDYSSTKMYKMGFAHTNNIINGGLECRATSSAAFTAKVVLRSELYKYYLGILGFTSNQIASENMGDYSTLCYESSLNAMQDYINCNVIAKNILPVTWLSFEVKYDIESKQVLLEWATSSEYQNQSFVIECSKTGSNFKEIGIKKGTLTTNSIQNYEFWDKEPLHSKLYYRIKQIDQNGKFSYSSVKMIEIKGERKLGITNYQNKTILYSNLDKGTKAKVQIYSMNGNTVGIFEVFLKKGQDELLLPFTQISRSVYFYRIELENQLDFMSGKFLVRYITVLHTKV